MIETPTLEWMAIAPELVTGGAAMLVLLAGMGRGIVSRSACAGLTALALVLAAGISIVQFDTSWYGAFGGQVDSDALANVGRIIAALCGLVTVVMAWRGRADDNRHAEFHALLLAAVCGMGLLAAAGSFVTLFVGLELFSIALYVMCALDPERPSSLESGLKYLIIGGLSSAVLLYGIALVFGATGTLDIAVAGMAEQRGALLWTGAAMVIGGMAFKVGAAPMHWWTPDAYEGAATPVTAFMSTATKAVALLALARVLVTGFGAEAETWAIVVAGLSVASVVVGNFGALVQPRLKRMLAYSSIAQAGYLLCGIVGWDSTGIASLTYALAVYAVMTMGAFAYVLVVERELGRDATYADLAGRGWVRPDESLLRTLPAMGMAVCMLSLAGIPPTAGFFSKFGLFDAAVESGFTWLAIVGVLGSVVSLAYYLRVLVELYMRQHDPARVLVETSAMPVPGDGPRRPVGTRMPAVATLGVLLAIGTLALAFAPSRIFEAGCDARDSIVADSAACTGVEHSAEALDAAADDAAAAAMPQ